LTNEEKKKDPTHYVITKETRDAIMGKLGQSPYMEVYRLISALYTANPVNIEMEKSVEKENETKET
jgi:hypothetical protein|tara:strand:- start:417 stop:614 length:198 start_codon:yes stop_codon:yes gene_type:complete